MNRKIFIVIPCWNGEKTIGRMLDSILAQSYQDWEVVVVDDQSKDATVQVLKRYIKSDSRIRYIIRNREPKGAQTCRNIGFDLSNTAEYICFFDSDDALAPYCLEQRVDFMERHPEIDFGVFPARAVTSDSYEQYSNMIWGFEEPKDTLQRMLQRIGPMVGWTNMYRKRSINDFGLRWDERIKSLQDSDWNIQALIKGLKFDYAIKEGAKFDYYYIVGDNVISKGISSIDHGRSHIYYLNKLVRSLSHNQQRKYYYELNSYYVWAGRICSKNRQATSEFMNSQWIQERVSVKIRFKILFLLKYRFSRAFFPIEFMRNNKWLSESDYRKSAYLEQKCCEYN